MKKPTVYHLLENTNLIKGLVEWFLMSLKSKMSTKTPPFELRNIIQADIKQCLSFLRENFFPFEPCAVNIDLCPLGYQIPALEKSIQDIINKGYSIGAFQDDQLIGLVILDDKDKSTDHHDNDLQMPEKFCKLDKFFNDLCTNYGQSNTCLELNIGKLLDVFIICTAYVFSSI